MSDRIFVTGIGIICSIGLNSIEVFESLISKKSGITNIEILDTKHKGDFKAGEIKLTNDELIEIAEVPKNLYYSRTALLGIIAVKEAINNSLPTLNNLKTGLVSATTVGGMDKTEDFYKLFLNDHTKGKLNNIVTHDCGNSTESIAQHTGRYDFVSTVSSACSSSLNSISYGARLIKHGFFDRVIVGGTDSLTRFTLNGFNSLMILDKEQCKPFDKNRMGLNLGEGAGFLILESENTIVDRFDSVICELKGWGNACDAFHQTASSPDGFGAYLAMNSALKSSGLNSEEIDYINAHGTGTQNNDLTEGIAIDRLFGSNIPPISSTKSYTGHTLGAAGAIESVISILGLNNDSIFPNLNFSEKMSELNFIPQQNIERNKCLQNILTNSFGFGGNCSSLIFSKVGLNG